MTEGISGNAFHAVSFMLKCGFIFGGITEHVVDKQLTRLMKQANNHCSVQLRVNCIPHFETFHYLLLQPLVFTDIQITAPITGNIQSGSSYHPNP